MQIIKKNSDLIREDILSQSYKAYIDVKYERKIFGTIYLILLVFTFPIGLTLLISHYEKYLEPDFAGSILVFVSFILLYMHLTEKKRTVGRMVSKHLENYSETTFLITEAGITEITNGKETHFNWNIYSHYVLRDEVLLTFENDSRCKFFPLKCYSDEERRELLRWVKSSIRPKTEEPENAFIKKPDKRTGIIYFIIAVLFIALIILSYLKRIGKL